MRTQLQKIASGVLLLCLVVMGSLQMLYAQQDHAATPELSVVTLDVTGMT